MKLVHADQLDMNNYQCPAFNPVITHRAVCIYDVCICYSVTTTALACESDVPDEKSVASCPGVPTTLPAPLADVVRPAVIEDFVGQGKVTGQNSFLRSVLRTGEVPSLIFWGPPGCGKVGCGISWTGHASCIVCTASQHRASNEKGKPIV